jgi:lysyl-tRNA synthetase class 2
LTVIGARLQTFKIRQLTAVAVAALALEAILSGLARGIPHRQPLLGGQIPAGFPQGEGHLLSVLVGLALLALTPRLWRGTRMAASLAIVALLALAANNLIRAHYGEGTIEASLAVLLLVGRGAFPLGCRNRPRLAIVALALGTWSLAYCAIIVAPLDGPRHALTPIGHGGVVHAASNLYMSEDWSALIVLLVIGALTMSVVALASLLRAAPGGQDHSEADHRAARGILDRHGVDSLTPFMLRPDKALQFAAGGVLAFRVIGETAVISSDPVAPEGAAPEVLGRFLDLAHERGWQVALWAASDRHLEGYRTLGLRSICVGEEAFVDPSTFTLEGRSVRKLRQSVHRVERRGWEILVRQGRDLDASLEAEIDAIEASWRSSQKRLIGFAMGMGKYDAEVRADDMYVLARDPGGELGAVMRFASYCGNLSLDTMRRVGETPNGLNEALVCRALESARELGVPQVSLNYAGLAHLVRGDSQHRSAIGRLFVELLVRGLAGRFQMERLVRFNEKFSPQWRPRYLVYESRATLPRSILRVLQAEGYVPGGEERPPVAVRIPPRGTLPGSVPARTAR